METQLFHVLLALMEEQKLRWNVKAAVLGLLLMLLKFLLVHLDGEVPKGHVVIGRCYGKNRFFSRFKL